MATATLQAILDASRFKSGQKVVTNSLSKMKQGVIDAEGAFVSLTRKIGRIGDSLGANISIAAGFSELVQATVQIQKYETTMTSFTGSLSAAREELTYVLDTANKFGVSFQGIATPFSKFAAAAEGFSKSDIHTVFEAFVTASSGLQLNMQEVNGVFLALQQIVSKGRLSMEELRLQLAERVPGAMRLAAQAANMSMLDFEAAVRKGTIDTRKWMVDFAELIESKFASAADVARFRLQASIMRLSNTFLVFKSRVVEVGGVSETLVRLFDTVSSKIFQNERVINALGGALGNLATRVTDFVEGIDDDKIAGFAEGLSELFDTITEAAGPVISDFISTLTDPGAWAHLKEATTNIGLLAIELGGLAGKILSWPGDIVDVGLIAYALFGKSGPGRVLAAMEVTRRKMSTMHPDMDMSIGSTDPFKVGTDQLEAAFEKSGKVINDYIDDWSDLEAPIEIELEPTITFPDGWTGFEELEEWRTQTKMIVNSVTDDFKDAGKGFGGMDDAYKDVIKSATDTWKSLKSAGPESSDGIFQKQKDSLNSLADVYQEALGGRAKKAIGDLKDGLAGMQDAIKHGVDTETLAGLGDIFKQAAQQGVSAFEKMGQDVNKIINDISSKQKQYLREIKKLEDDIRSTRQTASDARFQMLQDESTETEKYYNVVKRINALFRESNTLQEAGKQATGQERVEMLNRSNDALKRAFDLSRDLESTEENGISKAQAKADKLKAINVFEQKSVQNYKLMKDGAVDQLKAWTEVKGKFEEIGKTLTTLTDVLKDGLKIDFESDTAEADIQALQDKLKSTDLEGIFDNATEDIKHFGAAIRGIGGEWEDVLRDWENRHGQATNSVLKDLDLIERRVKAIFGSNPNYNVTVSGGDRYGGFIGNNYAGRVPGYGGGDRMLRGTEGGEYVLPKESTSHYGIDMLDEMRDMHYPKTNETTVQVKQPNSESSKKSQEMMKMVIEFPGATPDVEVEATPINMLHFKQGMSEYAKFSAQ